MRLSVIVPARNEADVIRACLESLLAQAEPGFALNEDWELLLVDDGSTDQTRAIAASLAGVQVLDPDPLKPGWTGKANACWTAAQKALGDWLLFTDADTIHEPGDLGRAMPRSRTRPGCPTLLFTPPVGDRLLAACAYAAYLL